MALGFLIGSQAIRVFMAGGTHTLGTGGSIIALPTTAVDPRPQWARGR